MRSMALTAVVALALCHATSASAYGPPADAAGPCRQSPPCVTPVPVPAPTGIAAPGDVPRADADANKAQAPSTDAFAQSPPAGGEAAPSALPNMIGDLPFFGVAPKNVYPTITTVTTVTTFVVPGLTLTQINKNLQLQPVFPTPGFAGLYVDVNTGQRFTAAQLNALTLPATNSTKVESTVRTFPPPSLSNRVPVTSYGGFKVSENGTVLPTDRVFATYNYFDVDGFHANSSTINREALGFEKTLFGGDVSIEMRAPLTETGPTFGGSSDLDALTVAFKYAAYRDRDTGNVISTGLAVSVPTGPDVTIALGRSINPTLLQPFVGYAFKFGRVYIEGFSEVIVPTDSNLPAFVANDVGVGYRPQSLPVIPTFEVHVNDALDHQGVLASPVGFTDSVILTAGLHFPVGRSNLTLGVATPVCGPLLFSVEAIAQVNCRF